MDAPASWRGVTGAGHAREHSGSVVGIHRRGHVDFRPHDIARPVRFVALTVIVGSVASWLAIGAVSYLLICGVRTLLYAAGVR